jgi:hypothetical protein
MGVMPEFATQAEAQRRTSEILRAQVDARGQAMQQDMSNQLGGLAGLGNAFGGGLGQSNIGGISGHQWIEDRIPPPMVTDGYGNSRPLLDGELLPFKTFREELQNKVDNWLASVPSRIRRPVFIGVDMGVSPPKNLYA